MERHTYHLPPITLLTILIEVSVIVFFSINATSHFLVDNPNASLPGYEGDYLTSSATFAYHSLQKYGYLPLWQPYLSHGEPLLDSPFSFVLNPMSIIPSLIFGSNVGIRYSVVLTAILAGLGGWVLARMLGLGSLSRVLLGLLLVGKGNMVAMVTNGFFQLGGSQAYIAWVIAGTLGILRLKRQRFPVALTAIMFTLMFWAGNIYFLLPTLMSMIGLGITHIVGISLEMKRFRLRIDRVALRRFVMTGLITLGLSAITFLPIFLQQENVGNHPREAEGGTRTDIVTVSTLFFSDSFQPYELGLIPSAPFDYQSYVLPFWFAPLALIIAPLLARVLTRPVKTHRWKVVSVALFMIVFCLLWGTGQNPIIRWLYDNVPLIAQWRFVGRMLSIVSFWLAVLAAMQIDSLWQALRSTGISQRPVIKRSINPRYVPLVRYSMLALLVISSLIAAIQVMTQWQKFAGPEQDPINVEALCVAWLRQQNPNRELSVWTLGYGTVTVYIDNDVRHSNIAAAYLAMGDTPTVYRGSLIHEFPEFAIAWDDKERITLREHNYVEVTESPKFDANLPCLWRKDDALPYAFTTPLSTLQLLGAQPIRVETTQQVTLLYHYPDRLALAVDGSTAWDLVLTVQEVAYPGWQVRIDDQPATLESVGGLMGVIVPANSGMHVVTFAYRPPLLYLGATITLISSAICVIYLLRLDRWLPQRRQIRETVRTKSAAPS